MKKSALALAVLGAFAGAASAQSSVTLFGVVDLGVRYVDNDTDSYWQLAQDGLASSRLGFRGVEDLGGGLKASFWLEGALGPDTGSGNSSYGNSDFATGNNAFMFRRRSTLSLSNQWGELRLGRDYTPTFWNWTVFDPFGTNGVGSATNLAVNASIRNAAGNAGAYGTLVRANNMVQYILPNGTFGPGLYGQVSVAAGEAGVANKYWGGRVGYAAGPFDVAAAYGWTEVNPNGGLEATNWNIAGSWSFGFMKLSAFYGQITFDDAPVGDVGQQNYYIGATFPMGQWDFKASYGAVNGLDAADGLDAYQFAGGAVYNLSKRTAFYGTASFLRNDRTYFSVSSSGPGPNVGNPRGNSSVYGLEVGIRHSF
jgi:predicted porin